MNKPICPFKGVCYAIRVDHKPVASLIKQHIVDKIIKFLHYDIGCIVEIVFEFEHVWLYATKDLEKVLGDIEDGIAFSIDDDYIQKIVINLVGE